MADRLSLTQQNKFKSIFQCKDNWISVNVLFWRGVSCQQKRLTQHQPNSFNAIYFKNWKHFEYKFNTNWNLLLWDIWMLCFGTLGVVLQKKWKCKNGYNNLINSFEFCNNIKLVFRYLQFSYNKLILLQ